MSSIKILGVDMSDTDYVLEIRVARKEYNFQGYMQKSMLEDLAESIKVLKEYEKFDLLIKEERMSTTECTITSHEVTLDGSRCACGYFEHPTLLAGGGR